MAHLLFLSHAGADTERALRLAVAIEASPEAQAAGLKVWVDKRPDGPHRLQAGTPWQDQLERAIAAESTAFGLLLTREGARNWVRLEVRTALDRVIAAQRAGAIYPFVPIIADDPGDLAHLPAFAQQYQGVRLTGDGQGLADLVRTAARLDAAQPVRLVTQPFMGLEAFEAKDAALFFGRRRETQDLVDRLRTTNLVLVTGDSGSGKSSLVKAGLIPAFREGALADPLGRRPEPGQWHVVEMRPGTDPFEGLVEGVGRAASAAGRSLADQGTLNEWVRTRDPDKIRDALRQSGPPGASLLLVVDQFEELWTLTTDDTRRRDFLAALLALVPEGDLARRVVGTMRRDYYHLHTDDEHLRDRLAANGNAGRFLLGAMAPESLRDIVEKPLLLAGEGETRAAALAVEVVKDVAGEPGNLALVEMALHETWERRNEKENGGDLTLAYQRLDRLEGALARAAAEVFWNPASDPKKLSEGERPVAEVLFMRLVRAGDIGGATRRPVAFAELEEPARAVARKLATPTCRRLLVLREPDSLTTGEEAITVELAHEQLVTQWPDYRFWLYGTASGQHEPDPTRATDKRSFDRLIDAARNWHSRGEHDEDLSRGGNLAEVIRLRKATLRARWLSHLERQFVDRSTQAEMDDRRRQKLRVQVAYAAVTALLVLTMLLGWQWQETEAAKVDAQSQAMVARASAHRADLRLQEVLRLDAGRLARLSQQVLDKGDAVTAILLAAHGLPKKFHPPDRPIVFDLWLPLSHAIAALRELSILRDPAASKLLSAKFSSDGSRIATISTDAARLWQTDGAQTPFLLRGDPWVRDATFTADSLGIVTISNDNSLQLWSITGGAQEPTTLISTDNSILAHYVGPADTIVATKSEVHSLQVLHSSKHRPSAKLWGHEDDINSASFSKDGMQLLTASDDGTARVWKTDNSHDPVILRSNAGPVRSAKFSPDSSRILTIDGKGTVRIWTNNGVEVAKMRGGEGGFDEAEFSPNSSLVATIHSDGTAWIWRADGLGKPTILRGQSGAINSLAFGPDSLRIITVSSDGTARIWSPSSDKRPTVLNANDDKIRIATFSSDGTRIAAGDWEGNVRIWHTNDTEQSILLRGHNSAIWSATFTSDSAHLLTTSADGTARLWRVQQNEVLPSQFGEGRTVSVDLSPDGNSVVTASTDGIARIWSVSTQSRPILLRGHRASLLSAKFSPNGKFVLIASEDGTTSIWQSNGQSESDISTALGLPDTGPVEFNNDGTRILRVAGSIVQVHRVDTFDVPILLAGHEGKILSARFSPDGERVVTASEDHTARVFSIRDPKKVVVLQNDGPLAAASFTGDSKWVVTMSVNGTARIWRADGMGKPFGLNGDGSRVERIVLSPKSAMILAIKSNGAALMWLGELNGNIPVELDSVVDDAEFSPDGTRLLTVSKMTLSIRRTDSIDAPIVLGGHEGIITSATFSPDGETIVTSSEDGTLRIWRANLEVGRNSIIDSISNQDDGGVVMVTGSSKDKDDWTAEFSDAETALEEISNVLKSINLPRKLTESQMKEFGIIDYSPTD